MKILYDHQIFERQQFGGISRYFAELLKHFENDRQIEFALSIIYSNNQHLKQNPAFRERLLPKPLHDPYAKFLWGYEFEGKGLLFHLRNKILPSPTDKESEANKARSIEKIKEGDFDIFHPTYYNDYFLDFIGSKPFVVTVYDLIHQIFPEFLLYDKVDKNERMLQKASKIIAISENTKRDLVTLFNIEESKVKVTHLANSLEGNDETVSDTFKNSLPQRYFLYIGNRNAYKNFLFFVQVFATLKDKERDLFIISTGPTFSKDELYYFKKIGVEGQLKHVFVNDSELTYLYKHTIAFIFPSLYEGFGIPVLEAFSCGCPVLLSDTSSLREIGEEGAIYFTPKDAASIIQAIKKALYNRQELEEQISHGFRQLQKFSWQKTAGLTKEIYREVVS